MRLQTLKRGRDRATSQKGVDRMRLRKDPSYRLHKHSGQAVVTLSDRQGRRRDYRLGKYGSEESRQKYRETVDEWKRLQRRELPGKEQPAFPDLTVNELLEKFWTHAQDYYRKPDGTFATDLADYKVTLRPVKHLFGHTMARQFSPSKLDEVRRLMIEGYEHPEWGAQPGLARPTINKRLGRIKEVWRWGVEKELVAASIHDALLRVKGLRAGKTKARESIKVKPVSEKDVWATLPHLLPQVAAMVQLQWWTGMRPGEVTIMRTIDLDTTGAVWLYRPGSHKNAWRDHDRVVAIGPKAQEVLKPWLDLNLAYPTDQYLFQPQEARASQDRQRGKGAKKPLSADQKARRRQAKPKRQPGVNYRRDSYGRAIVRACLDAGVAKWTPNQLRHSAATRIRREEKSLDVARTVLGQRSPAVTAIYAERDLQGACDVMARLG